ncbi:C40 family peptidase [Allobranchiibius sp. GilTou73]|uniref:C40 family peptidase n=1 Tax=Allobranchiibius sp. GilTou73 TaxID=2904523 RepID=UPI002714C55F|nr:C40 family peptidase [Allobranchiibius sp. GilTou73]
MASASPPPGTTAPVSGGSGGGSSTTTTAKLSQVISIAKQYLGVPYVYGGSTPAGFDCSGLTQYAYSHAGLTLPRTAAAQQAYMRSTSSPLPGDLVFFGSPAYHVGIYLGNGQMIAAPYPGAVVRIQTYINVSNFGTLR